MTIRGNTAIVTGGGRGIGKATALALGREGCNVVIASRSAEELDAAAREIEAGGGLVLALPLDLTEPEAPRRLVQQALERFGGLGILVNNAGVLTSRRLPKVTAEEWDSTMAINLRAVFLLAQAALAEMVKAGSGYIINVSSPAGLRPCSSLTSYGVSKAGVVALSQALFDEAKRDGVKVTTLYPGYVDTRMIRELEEVGAPPEQWATPEDMAECVLFLLRQSERVIVRDLMPLAFKAE